MTVPTFVSAFVWQSQQTMTMPHMVLIVTIIVTPIRPSVFAFTLALPVNQVAFEFVSRLLFLFLVLLGWCWVCQSTLQNNSAAMAAS